MVWSSLPCIAVAFEGPNASQAVPTASSRAVAATSRLRIVVVMTR